jgi:hypothetical protein
MRPPHLGAGDEEIPHCVRNDEREVEGGEDWRRDNLNGKDKKNHTASKKRINLYACVSFFCIFAASLINKKFDVI